MLLEVDNSCLLLVDVQEKLTPLVYQHQQLISHCSWLLRAAKKLGAPVLVGEQYPKGLGHTVPELKQVLPEKTPILEKVHFSCATEPACWKKIDGIDCDQVIIMGIEAHVCVLQTALELLAREKTVYVVADAVSSRNPEDIKYALDRMNGEGVIVVTREMVLFEWLRQANTDLFREVSKEFF